MKYKDYLKSDHWKKTRENKLSSRPFCQICGSKNNLNIHHKFYKYNKSKESIFYKETNSNLITLCSSCHTLTHKYFGNCKKINKKILRVKRLIELGANKKKSFWVVSQDNLFCIISNTYLQINREA